MRTISLKSIALHTLRLSGVFAAVRSGTASALRVLAYHGVESRTGIDNIDGFQVEPTVFARQLDHVGRYYRPVVLDEVWAAFAEGRPLPSRAVLITFDDGYANNFEMAAPILRQKGIRAAFFLTTGFLDGTHRPWWYVMRSWIARAGVERIGWPEGCGPISTDPRACMFAWEARLKSMRETEREAELERIGERLGLPPETGIAFMSWDQARELRKQGFALGAHTVRHTNLGAEDAETVRREVAESVARIRAETGVSPSAFAFPYGRECDASPAADAAFRESGITIALLTEHGLNHGDASPFRLKRLNVTSHYDGVAFEKLLAWGG